MCLPSRMSRPGLASTCPISPTVRQALGSGFPSTYSFIPPQPLQCRDNDLIFQRQMPISGR